MTKKILCMGFTVFDDELANIERKAYPQLINTISPNSYGISTKDALFRESLKKCDHLVLDGVYFALSSIFLNGKNIKKNQGPDVFNHFMHRINTQGGKVFFLGSTDSILEKILEKAAVEFRNITVATYSPPYKPEFTEADNREMVNTINAFQPDVVFIGMTCPKQEKWGFVHKEQLNTGFICCIGAVFDWYAGNQKEIAPIWWKLRLAWLVRTIHRPEILRRYPNIGIFFYHLMLAILGSKKYKYGRF